MQISREQIYTEEYKINAGLVNLQRRAGLYSVLNLIQDVGVQHTIRQKLKIADDNLVFFTRQKLVMQRWPRFNDVLAIKTWLRPIHKFIYRDYELSVDGEPLGICTSSFAVINAETRKPAILDANAYISYCRTDVHLQLEPEKIPLREDLDGLAEFQVRNSDIDLNNHVNNTRYAQWILDAVPIDRLRSSDLHEYEINFLAETKLGDKISIQGHSDLEDGTRLVQFQGLREADQKTVFVAQLKVTDRG